MKTIIQNLLNQKGAIGLLVVCVLMTGPALGDYEIRWHTIDGGGGVSSGGTHIVRGTIAQPEAAYSEGGQYKLLGGFWPGQPVCVVDFHHFAKFANYWLETGIDLPADLFKDENDIVDYFDLDAFFYEWMLYCPYDWPLK